jgi:hypothetical protein
MHAALLAFGFSWMIAAAIIGIVLGAKHDNHLERLSQLAKQGNLVGYNEEAQKYKAGATAHGHSFLFAVVLVLVAIVVERLPYSAPLNTAIPYALMCSTAVWTIAALRVIRPLMILADAVFFIIVVAIALGLVFNALPNVG